MLFIKIMHAALSLNISETRFAMQLKNFDDGDTLTYEQLKAKFVQISGLYCYDRAGVKYTKSMY